MSVAYTQDACVMAGPMRTGSFVCCLTLGFMPPPTIALLLLACRQTRGLQAWTPAALRFECTGCGDCCKVSGDVWMTADEAADVARQRGVHADEIMDVRVVEGGWRRLLRRQDKCVLLSDDNRCGAYAARPMQCSTYPFWPRILASREAWLQEPCEGIENTTALVPVAEASVQAQQWAAWLRRFPRDAVAAVEDVERWVQLVADLDLCPWARPSIEADGVRYVHSGAATVDDAFADLALAAADLVESVRPDAVAIAFVVLPDLHPNDFPAFRVVLEDLEDIFFCLPDEHGRCLADDVQLAGFHPSWTWAGEPPTDPVHFDKRAPHPTISLVRARAIDCAQHATANIAAENLRTLRRLGTDHLRRRFAACHS